MMNNFNKSAQGISPENKMPYKLDPLAPGQLPPQFNEVVRRGWFDRLVDKLISANVDVFRSPF